LITGSFDKTSKLWDIATGKEIRMFKGHSSVISSVNFSPDGKYLITGSFDKTSKLWDINTDKEIRTFSGDSRLYCSVNFSPDGKFILNSYKSAATLWEVETGKEIRNFKKHTGDIFSANFSPDGKFIITGGWDGAVTLWDVDTGKEIKSFKGHSSMVSSVDLSRDGKHIITANSDNTLKLWNLSSSKESRTLSCPNGVNSVNFSPDGKYIVTGYWNYPAKLWDMLTGKEIRTFRIHSAGDFSANFSPNVKYVATGRGSNAILWETTTGNQIRVYKGHSDDVRSANFSPDGKYVVTGSYDNTLKLWNIETGREIRTFIGHSNDVRSANFSPDGKYVVTGSYDNTLKLWNIETGREIRTFTGHYWAITSVDFSHDGKYIVTGSWDNTAKLWDITTGRELKTFKGHFSNVNSVKFSPDGKYIVTGSNDMTTKIWDTETGKELATLISIGENDWAVKTPDGFVDCSEGAKEYIHFVRGLEVYPFSQYADRFYQKGLLAKVVNQQIIPMPKIADTEKQPAKKEEKSPAVETKEQEKPIISQPIVNTEIKDTPTPKQIEKGNSIPTIPELIKNWFPNTKTWAVVIGIDKYSKEMNGFESLPYAVSDAKAIKNSLIMNMGLKENRIITLYNKDATKQNIEKLLGVDMTKKLAKNDRLIVYFSGHGETQAVEDNKHGYLIPIDGKRDELYSTCVSMKHIRDFCDLIPAQQILFIIDACYSGIAGVLFKGDDENEKKLRKLSESELRIYMEDKGRQIMTAGKSGEKASMGESWENHSVYTYYLLRGLKGEADYNKDGIITANELQVYLRTHVAEGTKKRQNPQIYRSIDEGEFIFFNEGD